MCLLVGSPSPLTGRNYWADDYHPSCPLYRHELGSSTAVRVRVDLLNGSPLPRLPHGVLHAGIPRTPCTQNECRVTYIDVFQAQEAQSEPVALPDDWRPQVSTNSAGQHRAQPHRHCGHTDLVLRGEAQLNHLCRGRRESRQKGTQGPDLSSWCTDMDSLEGRAKGRGFGPPEMLYNAN